MEACLLIKPIPLWIEVLDRISVVPNPVRVAARREDAKPSKVFVVQRLGAVSVKPLKWDTELLDIRQVGGNENPQMIALELTGKRAEREPLQTSVVLQFGDKETREVSVQIVP